MIKRLPSEMLFWVKDLATELKGNFSHLHLDHLLNCNPTEVFVIIDIWISMQWRTQVSNIHKIKEEKKVTLYFVSGESSWFILCTCLYVLSATHSRKKKIHTRDTRTTKLITTIERTSMSPFDPNAVIQSSVAECVASCSKSLAWESRNTNGIKPKIKDMTFPKIW